MRPIVLVPVVFLICSCAKAEKRPAAAKADSAVTADSASTTKKINSESASAASPRSASSGQSSAPTSQSLPGSAKAGERTAETHCGVKGTPVLTDLGIGNLSIGRTVDAVKASCRVIRDIAELTSEGT